MKLSFAVGMFGWMLAFLVLSASCGRPCTFTKSDLPVPEDSLIVGDPRKKEECKKTSFKATRPADLFDPAGVRLWTREEDTMAKSKDPFVNRMFMEEMMIDPFIFGQFNRIMGDESKNGFEVKFQLLKNLKAGSTTMVQLLDSSKPATFFLCYSICVKPPVWGQNTALTLTKDQPFFKRPSRSVPCAIPSPG